MTKGQEEAALNTAIFSAKPNKLERPREDPLRLLHLRSEELTPGNQQTLKQAEASIKQQLTATQQQAALSKFVKEFKKTWTAKTDCREEFVVMDCKQYKAPKTSSTSSTAVPTTSTPAQTTTAPADHGAHHHDQIAPTPVMPVNELAAILLGGSRR